MYRCQFTSTVEDLLEAEEAERAVRTVRIPFRWIIVILGLFFLLAGIISLNLKELSARSILWLIIGLVILYYFLIKPHIRRNKIKRSNAIEQHVLLEFNTQDIKLEIDGVGSFTRAWNELDSFICAENGIIFRFSDGVVNWIPERAFSDKKEQNEFINFLELNVASL